MCYVCLAKKKLFYLRETLVYLQQRLEICKVKQEGKQKGKRVKR